MKTVAIFLASLLLCRAQTQSTGQAKTSGMCSPAVTGNENQFTINCGIGKQQGEELLRIVNKIFANKVDLSEFGSKLDEILKGIGDLKLSAAGRRLTKEQMAALTKLASLPALGKERIAVVVGSNDPEAFRYAQDFASSFRAAGLELVLFTAGSDSTGVNQLIVMGGGTPLQGLQLRPRDESALGRPFVQSLGQLLTGLNIPFTVRYAGTLARGDLDIYIGAKPSN